MRYQSSYLGFSKNTVLTIPFEFVFTGGLTTFISVFKLNRNIFFLSSCSGLLISPCFSFMQGVVTFLFAHSTFMFCMVSLFCLSAHPPCDDMATSLPGFSARMPSRLPAICLVSQESFHNHLLARRCLSHYTQGGGALRNTWWSLSKQKNNLTPSSCAMMRSHRVESRGEAFLRFLIKTCTRLAAKRVWGSASPGVNVEDLMRIWGRRRCERRWRVRLDCMVRNVDRLSSMWQFLWHA